MSDRDASMPDLPDPDGEALKFDFRTPSLATTPFTFDRPTPITRPTVDPLAGPTGEVQRILAQILPAALEDVVKGTLDTLLQQAVASMEQKLSGTLNTLHADVKSLDTAVRRLDKARLPAPKRSLDSVIPKITIELTGNDYNIVAGRTRKQLLNQLHDQSPAVFKLIRVARLRRNHREVILETESWSAYRELIKTNRIAEITKRLCLQNLRSTIKHEKFWVVLLEHNFDESYLKDCTTHLNQWRLDTKLDIRGTLYKDNRLLWYFTTAHEATKACQRPLWFGEDRALALPFDIKCTAIWCYQCAKPGHTSQDLVCENHPTKKPNHRWPCLICGDKNGHARGQSHHCPNKSNKASYVCISCEEEGLLDTNHRTDFMGCPSTIAKQHRADCEQFKNVLPLWAADIKIPSTEELRQMVEGDVIWKSKNVDTQSTDTDGQVDGVNVAGSTGPARIVNLDEAGKHKGDKTTTNSNGQDGRTAASAIPVSSQDPTSQAPRNVSEQPPPRDGSFVFTPPNPPNPSHPPRVLVQSTINFGRPQDHQDMIGEIGTNLRVQGNSASGSAQRPTREDPPTESRSKSPDKRTKTNHDHVDELSGLPGVHHINDSGKGSPPPKRKIPQGRSPSTATPQSSTQTAEPARPKPRPKGHPTKSTKAHESRSEDAGPPRIDGGGVVESDSSEVIVGSGGETSSSQVFDNDDAISQASGEMSFDSDSDATVNGDKFEDAQESVVLGTGSEGSHSNHGRYDRY